MLEVLDYAATLPYKSNKGKSCLKKIPEILGKRKRFSLGRWENKAAYYEFRKLPLLIQKRFSDPPDVWKAEILRQKGEIKNFKKRGRSQDFAVNPTYPFTVPWAFL